jgi:hypothetical protein
MTLSELWKESYQQMVKRRRRLRIGNSDGDVEDGPQILDGGGADESSDEENTAAGAVGKNDDIHEID